MADHEIGTVQVAVDRRLRQEEAADSTADENRNEAEAEQGRRVETHFGAIQSADPEERRDRGRDGDDERRDRKHRRRERVHATHEHVMPPHRVAQKSNRDHARNQHAGSKQRLSRHRRENVRDDSETREYGDVDLGMSEEPEEVLPEERRPARVRLESIAYDEPGWNEEAGASHAVEQKQNAGGKQNRERDESDYRGDEPGPGGKWHSRQRHPFGPKIESCRDEIERSQ